MNIANLNGEEVVDEQSKRILLVEDEDAHAELVRRAFERHGEGFNLTVVYNLEQARAYLAESLPNLVIADWRLPDGRGTDLLPIEGEVRQFPLVVMTSYGDEQLAVDAMKAGALDYIVKSDAVLADMPHIAERALREWGHITEQVRAEERLRESEAHYRLLAENITDIIWTVDMNLRFTYISSSVTSILGYSVEEAMALTLGDVLPPASLEVVKQTFAEELAVEEMEQKDLSRSRTLELEYYSKDGSTIWTELKATGLRDRDGQLVGILGVARDITERVRAQEALLTERNFTNTLVQASPAFFVAIGADGKTIMMNDSMLDTLGYSAEEVVGCDYLSTFVPARDHQSLSKVFEKLTASHEKALNENHILTKAGQELLVEWHGRPIFNENNEFDYFFGVGIDITERKQAQEALQESEEHYRLLAENITDLIWTMDMNFRFTYMSPSVMRSGGYSVDEAMALSLEDILTPASFEIALKVFEEELVAEQTEPREAFRSRVTELEQRHKDGHTIWTEVTTSFLHDSDSQLVGILGVTRDITERKQAEQSLRESEKRYHALFEQTNDTVFIISLDGIHMEVNPQVSDMLGYAMDEIIGRPFYDFLVPEEKQLGLDRMAQLLDGQTLPVYERTFLRKDGTKVPAEINVTLVRDAAGKPWHIHSVVRDITERKQVEKTLRRVDRALRTLSECNQAVVRATEESDLLHQICQIVVQVGGYRLAWVGFAQQDEEKTVRPVAQSGFEEGYLETLDITWADTERGRGPTGTAIHSGEYYLAKDITTDPRSAPWRAAATQRGYASSLALPLNAEGKTFGALNIYAFEPDAFDADEVKLLTDLANDLAYGIMALRTRAERLRVEQAMQESEKQLQTLIDTMPDFVCFKDGDGRWLKANEATIRIFQLEGIDYQGKKDSELAELDSSLRASFLVCKETDERTWKGGALVRGEEMVPRPDGSVRVYDVIKMPVFHPGGERKGLVVLGRDITERKQAQEALRESEERYRTIFETAGVSIWEEDFSAVRTAFDELQAQGVTDLRGYLEAHPEFVWQAAQMIKVVDVNETTVEMFEADSKAELLTSLDRIFLPETMDTLREEVLAFAEGRTYFEGETVNQTLHGKRLNVFLTMHVLKEAEKPNHVLVSMIDITERVRAEEALRESEERYRGIIESTDNGIAVYKPIAEGEDFVFVDFNPMAEKIDKITKEEVIGKKVTEVFPGIKAFGLFKVFQNVWKSGEAQHHPVSVYKDDRIQGYRENYVYKLSSGEIVAIYQDLIESKRAEEALQESEERYRTIFETAGVSIWEEDFSEVRAAFDELQAQGVTDLRGYLEAHPEFVWQAAQMVKVVDVNQTTVEMFAADSKAELLTSLDRIFLPDTLDDLREEFLAFAEGRTYFEGETVNQTLDGKRLNVFLTMRISKETQKLNHVLVSMIDISERVRAEEELIKLANVIKNSSELVNLAAMDGKMIFLNKAGSEMLGIEPDEVEQVNIMEVIPDHLKETVQTELLPTLMQGNIWEGNLQYCNIKTGYLTDVHAITFPIKEPITERPLYLANVSQDITERLQAQEALRESEGKYRSLTDDVLDSSGFGIFILDSSFRVVWVNKGIEEYFGLKRNDIIGKDKRQLIRERIKDIFENPDNFADHVFTIYDENTSIDYFECHVLPTSELEERWLEHRSQPIQSGLYVGGRIEHYYDITERVQAQEALRESEGKYRSLIEQSNDAIYLLYNERFEIINQKFTDLFGITKDEANAPDFSFLALVAPRSLPMIRERFKKLPESQELDPHYQFTAIDKNGDELEVDVSVSYVSYKGGTATQGILRDITEQVRAREELQASLQEKTELNRELYHRTKNNMQVVISMLMLQSEYTDNQEIQRISQETINRIQAMSLVHEKLYQSQNLSSINLDDYIYDLVQLLVKTYQVVPRKITLRFDMERLATIIDTAVPCGLVLNELISNALKHAFPEEQEGEIWIRLHRMNNREILLEVSDNGIGLPRDFDFRNSETFGLQIIVAIVEHQLQGRVDFEGDAGLNCQVRFRDDLYEERV